MHACPIDNNDTKTKRNINTQRHKNEQQRTNVMCLAELLIFLNTVVITL